MKSSFIAALCMLYLSLIGCDSQVPELEAIPIPSYAGLAKEDQERLRSERSRLDIALSSDSGDPALARAFSRIGQAYMAFEMNESAIPAFRNSILLDSRDGASHYQLGLLYTRTGDFRRAQAHLQQAVQLRPNDCVAKLRLADVLVTTSHSELARPSLEAAQDAEPCSAAANARLARVALELGDPQLAIGYAQTALALQPQAMSMHAVLSSAWRQSGNKERSAYHASLVAPGDIEFLDPLVQGLSRFSSGGLGLLRQAEQARAAGQDGQALALLNQAVERQPDLWQAHLIRGQLQAEAGAMGDAEASLRIAQALAPADTGVAIDLAAILARQGNTSGAIETLGRLIEQQPSQIDARMRRSELLSLSGQAESAAADLQEVLRTDPRHLEARLQLSSLFWSGGQDMAAIDVLTQGIDDAPEPESQITLLTRRMLLKSRLSDTADNRKSAADDARGLLSLQVASAQDYLRLLEWDLATPATHPETSNETPLNEPEVAIRLSRLAISLGRYELAAQLVQPALAEPPLTSDGDQLELQVASDRAALTQPIDPATARAIAQRLASAFNQNPTPEIAELTAIALSLAGQEVQAVEWQDRLIELARSRGASENVLARLLINREAISSGRRPVVPEEFGLRR